MNGALEVAYGNNTCCAEYQMTFSILMKKGTEFQELAMRAKIGIREGESIRQMKIS